MIDDNLTSRLAQWEWMHLECILTCEHACTVRMPDVLALRPRLHRAAKELAAMGIVDPDDFPALFDPPLPADPVVRRRFQKPSPPFVFRYAPAAMRSYQPGESFRFELVLMGRAVAQSTVMLRVVERLAESGFGGEGAFELSEVQGRDDSGNRHVVWCAGDDWEEMAPPVCSADWWVARNLPDASAVTLNFVTPARLMRRGKPLFEPVFSEIFPFLLRRVTAACVHHAGLPLIDDAQPLLEAARTVACSTELTWEDWRTLPGGGDFEVGGLLGRCRLQGEGLAEILWLLSLGELLQLGRGVAYGAGRFELTPAESG